MLIISDIYYVLVPVRLYLIDRSKGKYSEHIKNISMQLFEMSNFYAQPNNSFMVPLKEVALDNFIPSTLLFARFSLS